MTSDPFLTLFVSNLVINVNKSYEISEEDLRKLMEPFGQVVSVTIVKNKITDKPKGYAFVQFDNDESFKNAYRSAPGLKLNNRKIIVDVERGRTVAGWKPKKAGGGLGKHRVGRQIQPARLPPAKASVPKSTTTRAPPRQPIRPNEREPTRSNDRAPSQPPRIDSRLGNKDDRYKDSRPRDNFDSRPYGREPPRREIESRSYSRDPPRRDLERDPRRERDSRRDLDERRMDGRPDDRNFRRGDYDKRYDSRRPPYDNRRRDDQRDR